MIFTLGFLLNVEISGNMKNQRNPFPHRSEFVTSAQVLCFINTPGPKWFGMQIPKTNDFLLNARCIFSDVYLILWKTYVSTGKRMFTISSERIGNNLIQIWDWDNKQNTIILHGLNGNVSENTKFIVVTT